MFFFYLFVFNTNCLFKIWEFEEQSTEVEFAGTTTLYSQNTVKMNAIIHNWPFYSLSNSLSLVMQSGSPNNDDDICVSQELDNDRLRWFMITVGEISLYQLFLKYIFVFIIIIVFLTKGSYGQYLENAIVDGRSRQVKFSLNPGDDNTIQAILPHFWSYAGI